MKHYSNNNNDNHEEEDDTFDFFKYPRIFASYASAVTTGTPDEIMQEVMVEVHLNRIMRGILDKCEAIVAQEGEGLIPVNPEVDLCVTVNFKEEGGEGSTPQGIITSVIDSLVSLGYKVSSTVDTFEEQEYLEALQEEANETGDETLLKMLEEIVNDSREFVVSWKSLNG